jgi:tight adherence protein C
MESPMPILIAAEVPGLLIIANGVMGAAVAVFVYWLYQVLRTEDLPQDKEWRYDVTRINELRRIDVFYRVFQPVIQLLAAFNRAAFRDALPEIQREIQAAGLPRFWLAEEYLARAELLALALTPLYGYFLYNVFGMAGLLVAVGLTVLTAYFLRRRLAARAKWRLVLIKRRMPFLLDLLTLLMEAGSSFLNALAQGVKEFHGHPVAEEFGRVLADMHLGKTRYEAFTAMRDRLSDDEITSIIGAILQGEELGTPLAHIFRTQADLLRLKRTQRAETIAGEAGVNMLLPGVLIMMATVLIIIGPFLMNYLQFGLSM